MNAMQCDRFSLSPHRAQSTDHRAQSTEQSPLLETQPVQERAEKVRVEYVHHLGDRENGEAEPLGLICSCTPTYISTYLPAYLPVSNQLIDRWTDGSIEISIIGTLGSVYS